MEACHLQSQGLQTGLLENYNLVLVFLYYRQSWKEFLLLFHPWPEKMLLVNLPSMLTKGLLSILLSHPEKKFSYFFFFYHAICYFSCLCYSSYHILPNGSLQLFHSSHSAVATNPSMHHLLFPIHHQLVTSTFHDIFLLSFIQTATSQLTWLHPEDGGSTFFWEVGTHPTDYSVKKCTPNFGLFNFAL